MKISFFEEFPNEEMFKKLKLVDFKTKIYLADYSVYGFQVLAERIKRENKNVKEFVYWPLLNVKDGYWFSPFSRRKAFLRSFQEIIENKKMKILFDAELPITNKKLIFTQFLKHFKNRKYIKGFLTKNGKRVYSAEYFFDCSFSNYLLLSIDPKVYGNNVIKMMYSSMMGLNKERKEKRLVELKKEIGAKLLIGLGVMGYGILGNEKQISSEALEEDLELCKKTGIKEVVIYRLGGLNDKYLRVIKRFV